MGGILILSAMLISLLLWMDLRSCFTLILAITTVFLGCLGGIDDYLKLKYKNAKGLLQSVSFCCRMCWDFAWRSISSSLLVLNSFTWGIGLSLLSLRSMSSGKKKSIRSR